MLVKNSESPCWLLLPWTQLEYGPSFRVILNSEMMTISTAALAYHALAPRHLDAAPDILVALRTGIKRLFCVNNFPQNPAKVGEQT
jgi:hypothetical protein